MCLDSPQNAMNKYEPINAHFKVAALHAYTLVITMQMNLALVGKQ